VHHIAYRVDDVTATLARLRDEGFRLIDEDPRRGSRESLIAFVHPNDMGGVLVELVQLP
jgi:methylmalonyl-CoA/ethylmalonyl-CoA epimerase